jgi:hypothetical protein
MNSRRLVLMMVAVMAGAAAAGSWAVADDEPPKSRGSEPPAGAGQKTGNQEIEKRLREGSSSDARENDRLFKRMVKANPKDVRAWRLLGWNEAHTLSLQSQDMNDRYEYVKRGIEHLVEGLGHSPTNAGLYFEIGWHLQYRIGQMDDGKPLRALFREDKEFHKLLAGHVDLKDVAGPDGMPDNFLVARRWHEKTIEIVERHGEPKESGFPPPLSVYSMPAACQRLHATALEHEGHFGETAGNAWKRSLKMWVDFGEREFVGKDGTKARLRDDEQLRMQVNYDYWEKRCRAEQTEPVLAARQAGYRAKQRLAEADLSAETRQLFDRAFGAWAEVDKEHPWLLDESGVQRLVRQYQRFFLDGKPLPDDFPLRRILER